jgi:flavin reductase (DIM6/NTAB) family NADH-FMN oxidoreductase RutF
MECKAHIECTVIWTKVIGSACLVLGSIEAIFVDKELEEASVSELAVVMRRPIFFSYQQDETRGFGCLVKWEKSTR